MEERSIIKGCGKMERDTRLKTRPFFKCGIDGCLCKECSSKKYSKKIIMETPKEFLEVSENDFQWKPCLMCGSEITQERKAFFVCINCGQTYIADEEDMKK